MTDTDQQLLDTPAEPVASYITDYAFSLLRERYGDHITEEDIKFFTYAVLHAPDFREAHADDLKRDKPRIPLPENFEVWRATGEQLASIHADYEMVPELLESKQDDKMVPVVCLVDGKPDEGTSAGECYRVANQLKFARSVDDTSTDDRSVIVINERCALVGLPDEAYEYQVSGKSPLEWFMAHSKIEVLDDYDPTYVEDINEWHEWAEDDDAFNLVRRLRQLAWVSVETTRLIAALPLSMAGNYLPTQN